MDLANLNVNAEFIAKLPLTLFLPQMGTPAQHLGVLYVIEGSMMGGKIIAKKLDSLFGEQAKPITNYFRGYDEKSMQRWDALCQCLERASNSENEQEQIIIAACETFLIWEKCLNTKI